MNGPTFFDFAHDRRCVPTMPDCSGSASSISVALVVTKGSNWAIFYLPTIRIKKEPGTIGPRPGRPAGPGGALAGGGPNSTVMVSP